MTILTKVIGDGIIKCKTEIDGRRYRIKYRGCTITEARKKFRRRVEAAEIKLMEERRQELINICLNCRIPVSQCKGDCKTKRTIKIKRGKGIK